MPNHKTPHPTDGRGIGKKLRGPELSSKLSKLARTANKHHLEAKLAWRGWLEHARQAGEALIEVKRRLGHRSNWSKWRSRNFNGSKETSCHYMRVAREWENPIIADARIGGVTIDSINKFLKLLRGQLTENRKDISELEEQRCSLRKHIRREFDKRLRELTDTELDTLASNGLPELETFNTLWEEFHKRLQQFVQVESEAKKEPRKKVSRALTKRRDRRRSASRRRRRQEPIAT